MNRSIKIGRLELTLMNRLQNDGEGFIGYVSWCYPSETIYFWKWELNIQKRRDPKKMYH